MSRFLAEEFDSRIIPAGFNVPLEFLTGFTVLLLPLSIWQYHSEPPLGDLFDIWPGFS